MDPTFKNVPFGGKVLILGGDFKQVLPVVPRASRISIVNHCITRSFLWASVKSMHLTIIMRIQVCSSNENSTTLATFERHLLVINDGNTGQDDNIDFDDNVAVPGARFDDFVKSYPHPHPRHDSVRFINDYLLEFPSATERVCLTADSLHDNQHLDRYVVEVLNFLEIGNLPPHVLRLNIGCSVMLLRNLGHRNGLCNGTRLICRSFSNAVINVDIASGRHSGSTALIPHVNRFKLSHTF